MKVTVCTKKKFLNDTVVYLEMPQEQFDELINSGYSIVEESSESVKLFKEEKENG